MGHNFSWGDEKVPEGWRQWLHNSVNVLSALSCVLNNG